VQAALGSPVRVAVPQGTVVPEFMDSELVARSLSRRIEDRVQTAILLAVLLGTLAAVGIFRIR